MRLTIDFETRSRCDLKKCGMYVYAEHPSTEVLCLAFKEDHKQPYLWLPEEHYHYGIQSEPDETLRYYIEKADTIHAHNAGFERCIWREIMFRRLGFPDIPLEKWRCTAAKAAAAAIPRDLGRAGEALGLSTQKDKEGWNIMMEMCKPLGGNRGEFQGMYQGDPVKFQKLCDYCLQDVEAEHALCNALPDLPPRELEVWRMDQRLNDRGIYIQVDEVERMIEILSEHTNAQNLKLQEIAQGRVKTAKQVAAMLDVLASMGVDLPNLQANTVKEALEGDLPSLARKVLEIRQELGRSSVSKYEAMLRCVCKDNRVRGTLLYHGCSTGRWSGKLIQPQNFPKGTIEDPEEALQQVLAGEYEGSITEAASSTLRSVMTAGAGNELLVGDFKQIEARVLAWLAGEQGVLDAFQAGSDLYKVAASDIFSTPYEEVTKPQRHVGKTAVLALGYQGGIGAFASMADIYDVDLDAMAQAVLSTASENEMEWSSGMAEGFLGAHKNSMSLDAAAACDIVKGRWRAANENIVSLWHGLEDAALQACKKQSCFKYGPLAFAKRGKFLYMRLPSGRLLSYCDPTVTEVRTPWGEYKEAVQAMSMNTMTNKWIRRPYYGGLWAENATQAVSRDIMAWAMVHLERAGYDLVLSVHDEVGAEVPQERADLAAFQAIMERVPSWASGLPVGVDCWQGKRYKKE
jgi:DNA polymerase